MNALLLARARAPFFSLSGDDRNGNPGNLQQRQNPQGKLAVLFAEDQFKPKSWLTLNGHSVSHTFMARTYQCFTNALTEIFTRAILLIHA